jgi:hypothetical protein
MFFRNQEEVDQMQERAFDHLKIEKAVLSDFYICLRRIFG